MWRLLYNSLLIPATPIILCILLAKKRCRRGLRNRLGIGLRPVLDPTGERHPLIWVHAVSLGEVVAVTPLVKEWHRRHPDHRLIVSTVTETGREAVEQRLAGIAEHRYAPLDLPWAVSRAIDCWRPALYVFVETELWPNLLWSLHRQGVPAMLVNGRLSSRSFARQHVTGLLSFYRSVLRTLALCLMQSDRDAERIVALGADPARVKRTGNIKFDQPMPAMSGSASYRASLGVGERDTLLLAGSTHAGEEEMLIEAYRLIVLKHPSSVLMLAPRHIERVEAVSAMITAAGLPVQRKSRLESVGAGPRVILLDTRGELAGAYREAAVAFVGGTLVPVGGHNVLEPAVWGTPVLFGPYTDHCAEIAALLVESGGAIRVSDAESVARAAGAWLESHALCRRAGEAARQTVRDNQGALQRSLDLIDASWTASQRSLSRPDGPSGQPVIARP